MTDTVEVILIIKYELEVLLVAIYAYKNNLYKLSESSNFFLNTKYKKYVYNNVCVYVCILESIFFSFSGRLSLDI